MPHFLRRTVALVGCLETRTIVASITISVLVHLAAWMGLGLHGDLFPSVRLLALLTLVDILMWFVLLLVPIAAIRKRLCWADPLVYFCSLFLASTVSFFPVFMANWRVAVVYIQFGGNNFPASPTTAVVRVIEAELLITAFMAVITLVNLRTTIVPQRLRASRLSRRAALLAAVLFCSAGVLAFVHEWTVASYVEAFLSTGAREASEPGAARYVFLQQIGGLAASLGMIAWLLRRPRRTMMSTSTSLFFAAIVAVTLIPVLVSGSIGSRIDLFFCMAAPIVAASLQGFRISRKVAVGAVCLLLALFFLVTLLRGQPQKPDSLSGLRDVPGLIQSYVPAESSSLTVLLQMDRVGNVALLLQQLATVGHYVNGSTLIANWDASIVDLTRRAIGVPAFYEPIMQANEHMTVWRFGFVTPRYPVPPSVVGDMFMQHGMLLFLPLSLLFSLLVLYLRRLISRSKTWYGQFFLTIVTLKLLTSALAQISLIGPFLIFVFLPFLIGFSLVRICFTVAAVSAKRVGD
jgi:hypothetical protein